MRVRPYVLASSFLVLCAGQPQLIAQSDPVPSLSVYSREVVIDVTVTDAKNKPIHGLTKENFTVTQDGKPITPSSFREHRADEDAAPNPAQPSLPPNTFTNAGPPEGVHPLAILLLDSLDIPIATQSIVQKQAAEFMNKLAPGTHAAVFGLSATGQLSLVQGFTTDQELLKKAVKSKKLDLQIPPLEDFGQEPDNNRPSGLAPDKRNAQFDQPAEKLNQDLECNHVAERGRYTFAALSEIARYVSGMPGRKNLIWFTGLFPTNMNNKQGGSCVNFREDFRVAGERLGHSHVVLYPIDPRAMDVLASEGPDSRIVRIQNTEHLRMQSLADDSGGKAFYTTNDLAAAAAEAVNTGSNYYTVTYTPANQLADTRQHTVSITVDHPDVTLIYRHHYHAVPPGETVSGQNIEKATPLETAMLRGALQPTEILFHVTLANGAAPDPALPAGNTPDPKAMKPPYRHVTLSYNIDVGGIQFDASPDGNYQGQFEYGVKVYDSGSGKIVNSAIMAAHPRVPAAVYQSFVTGGAKLRQEIAIPATGDYLLRIGVHDLTTDRVGALEIPVSAVTR